MEWFFFWLLFAIVVGVIASNRGRTGFGWFMVSVLLSPLLGLILVLAIGRPKPREEIEGTYEYVQKMARITQCPFCKEEIRRDAIKCKHCGSDLAAHEAGAQTAPQRVG